MVVSQVLAPALSFVASLPAGSRVGVVGSREFPDLGLVRQFVGSLPASAVVVSGGARGVDQVAASAAKSRGLAVDVISADWSAGRSAGMIRNRQLVASCSAVAVFLCCGSAGASSSIALARQLRVPVFVVPCGCIAADSLWG